MSSFLQIIPPPQEQQEHTTQRPWRNTISQLDSHDVDDTRLIVLRNHLPGLSWLNNLV
jgi:hypothetical protein